MFDIIKVFFTGMFISFLGSLPLGSLNVAAMQVAVEESVRNAVKFALGVALVEIIYVRVSLGGMDWVVSNQTLFHILEWATVFLFLILAISTFLTLRRKAPAKKNILLNNKVNRFWLGLTMSAINPVQIPFWFLWSTYLLSNHILLPTSLEFNMYTIGIGIGTLLGFAVFIYGGKWLVRKLNAGQRAINLFVAIVFLVSAVIQLYRVLRH